MPRRRCVETRARVRTRVDIRRLEVATDGLSLRGGAHFAVDTTLVSMLVRREDHTDGAS